MMTEQAFRFRDLCIEKDRLITELCDAVFHLSREWDLDEPYKELIQRAREATR